jgi:hypothetical protein
MIYIFAGPTISHNQIKQHLDCLCLPPVCHGDILQVLEARPTAIGIIDGYFEGAPSVWHKEILYALDQGVHVFGSSSMGALRAAELYPFGMQGVGKIFQWYKGGVIEADDEVAVLHGPAEVGYLAVSEPLVNIRATLAEAERQGKISSEQKGLLIENAKATYYKDRSWNVFLSLCTKLIGDTWKATDLKVWFELNRIDLKKQDALELLDVLAQHIERNVQPFKSDFYFENTNVWSAAVARHERSSNEALSLSGNQLNVLNQLRLEPDRYERYSNRALITWLSDNRVEILNEDINPKKALGRFRVNNDLASHPQLMDCLEQMELNEGQLTELLEGACRAELVRLAAGNLQSGIIQELKLDGAFLQLLDVDRRKQEVLNRAGIEPDTSQILPPQVLVWYFRTKLGITLPLSIDEHLKRIDLKHSDEFYRLITAEYLYCCEVISVNSVE